MTTYLTAAAAVFAIGSVLCVVRFGGGFWGDVMPSPVRDKADMYARLSRGEFGNTIRQWFDFGAWYESPDRQKYEWWGVRTLTPGGPCQLNAWRGHVANWCHQFAIDGHRVNISMMVDKVAAVTAWLEIWDSPTGLVVEGIEWPDTAGGWTWRNSMPDPQRRRRWEGTAARMVLGRHLNADSRDDLGILLEQYPDHVVELSSLDRCIGTAPHRNAVVWECRAY